MGEDIDQARHAYMNACAARDVAYEAYNDARRAYNAARRASDKAFDAYFDARWPVRKDDSGQ